MARRMVVLADPADPRVEGLRSAMAKTGFPPPEVVPYTEFVHAPGTLRARIPRDALLRIDSPGRSAEARAAILDRGYEVGFDGALPAVSPAESLCLSREKGLLVNIPQWYRGFRAILSDLHVLLADRADITCTADPEAIATLFDKTRTNALLREADIPVPEFLGNPRSYTELSEIMHESGHARVFVKLRYGSSAAGIVAFERAGARVQAWTTVELARAEGEVRLYNTRQIRRLREEGAIADVVDALCQHEVHVERWVPKGGLQGHRYDIRQLVIGGEPAHGVARLSKTPMTNLHLLNKRAPIEAVREQLPEGTWPAIEDTCRRIAAQFPGNLQVAPDIAISPCGRRHWVLEVNAFGDLLHGCLHEGRTTYEHELAVLHEQEACHA